MVEEVRAGKSEHEQVSPGFSMVPIQNARWARRLKEQPTKGDHKKMKYYNWEICSCVRRLPGTSASNAFHTRHRHSTTQLKHRLNKNHIILIFDVFILQQKYRYVSGICINIQQPLRSATSVLGFHSAFSGNLFWNVFALNWVHPTNGSRMQCAFSYIFVQAPILHSHKFAQLTTLLIINFEWNFCNIERIIFRPNVFLARRP